MQGSSNKAWHIAQGPLSVVFGVLLGMVAALSCSATRLWNNKYKLILAVVISGGWSPCDPTPVSFATPAPEAADVHVVCSGNWSHARLQHMLTDSSWLLGVFAAETPETVIYHPAALSMKYFFDQYDFESGGALAALTLGLTVKELWRRQWPRFLARQVWPVGQQFL